MAQVCDPQFGLVVEPSEVTRVNADAPVADVAKRLAARMMDDGMQDDEVIAVVDGGRLVGAVEIARIVEAAKDC